MDLEEFAVLKADADAEKATGAWAGAPAVPATTVAATNTSGVPMWVRINAGTVTGVAVDGVTIGGMTTNDWVRLRANSTIAITYSVAPTWQWFEE